MDYVEHMRFASALLLVFAACAERVPCAATGGVWETCPSTQPVCVNGTIVEGGDAPAMCEAGCACPDDAPVWDPAIGCIAASDCICTDNDGDGACSEDDCDDSSAAVAPGIEECWLVADAVDNNCDGRVDECSCADATGFTPDSPEVCDGRDNNCDGVVDEGCE